MMTESLLPKSLGTDREKNAVDTITSVLFSGKIPQDEIQRNIGLFIDRRVFSRIMFMYELYKLGLNINGSIMEFGVRWGQNIALFSSFRGMLEPFNHFRKIIGFDTFEGFTGRHEKDGDADFIHAGAYNVSPGYEATLEAIMSANEDLSPNSHIRKFEIVKGDVTKTLDAYLEHHPETIISMAYFDMDLYEPTEYVLRKILPRMPKGAVIGFDELNCKPFPGETRALHEVMGISNVRLQRLPFSPNTSYIIIE